MVFSSMVFLCVFLPVVFGLHLLLPGMRAKNCLLVIASLLFYAYGEPVYVILLIGSSIGNYIFARLVGEHPKFKRISMALAVIVNLGLLVLFKYSGFLVETFNSVTNAGIPVPEIRMPIRTFLLKPAIKQRTPFPVSSRLCLRLFISNSTS